jgi:hypothetical protein
VDLSDDLPPARRPLFFPVVIATVFLSIIGMSAGLVLGAQQKRAERQEQQRQQQQQQVPVVQPTSDDPRPECRPETQKMAQRAGATGALRIQLLLRTASSAVWICEDESGRLFYHGNRGGEDGRWVENETALFMSDVQRDGSDEAFVVTAVDGTNFSITSKRLFIIHKDGREEIQTAVR